MQETTASPLSKGLGRDPLWDIAKGLAIMLVVLGHSLQAGAGTTQKVSDGFLYLLIYSFNMPLFAVISGYFFSRTLKKHMPGTNLSGKLKSLLLPVVLIGSILFLVNLWAVPRPVSAGALLKEYALTVHKTIWYDLWFLWAILLCSLISLFIHQYLKNSPFAYIVVILLSFVTPDYFNLAGTKFLFPCFAFGLWLSSCWERIREWPDKRLYAVSALLLATFAVLFHWFTDEMQWSSTRVYIFSGILGYSPLGLIGVNLYRIVTGVCGSLTVISVIYLLLNHFGSDNALARLFIYPGRHTKWIYIYSVYIQHYTIVKYGMAEKMGLNYTLFCILFFLSVFTVSYGLAYLTDRYLKI